MLSSTESLRDLREQWEMCGVNEMQSSYLSFLLQSGTTFRNFDIVFPQSKHLPDTQLNSTHSGLILSEKDQSDFHDIGDVRRANIKDVIKFNDRVSFD